MHFQNQNTLKRLCGPLQASTAAATRWQVTSFQPAATREASRLAMRLLQACRSSAARQTNHTVLSSLSHTTTPTRTDMVRSSQTSATLTRLVNLSDTVKSRRLPLAAPKPPQREPWVNCLPCPSSRPLPPSVSRTLEVQSPTCSRRTCLPDPRVLLRRGQTLLAGLEHSACGFGLRRRLLGTLSLTFRPQASPYSAISYLFLFLLSFLATFDVTISSRLFFYWVRL